MAKRKRQKRLQRRTLLIIGEGHTETAFLKHIKDLYCRKHQGPKVKILNAHGKGPEHILKTAIRNKSVAEFDTTLIVLDTDVAWPPGFKKEANKCDIYIIGFTPCIEALFLELINVRPIPQDTHKCKEKVQQELQCDLTKRAGYAQWCTNEALQRGTHTNKSLCKLLNYYRI